MLPLPPTGKADGEPAGEGAAAQVSSQKASRLDSAPKAKRRKDSKKDDAPPIEAIPPPGPLVALGQPRPKLQKRPLDVALGNVGSHSLAKKPLPSPTTAGKGNDRTYILQNYKDSTLQHVVRLHYNAIIPHNKQITANKLANKVSRDDNLQAMS